MASLISLTVSLGADVLSVRRFTVEETISNAFTVDVWAVSPNDALDLEKIVGANASLSATLLQHFAPLGGARKWTGVVSHIEQVAVESAGLSTYYLRIVPDVWLLHQRTNHRVFQHLSIPDIVDKVLADWPITFEWKVDRPKYPKLEYKVQYGESDYNFLSRLLEEAGISFVFPDSGGVGTALTFADALHSAEPRVKTPIAYSSKPDESRDTENVSDVHILHEVRPGAWSIRDYDFRNPNFPLFGDAPKAFPPEDRYEQYHYDPGSFRVEGAKGGDTPVADDRGVARHEQKEGASRAARFLEAQRANKRVVSFNTNTIDLWPGIVLSVEGHPHTELGGTARLLLTHFSIEGTPGQEWNITGKAVFADVPYRAPLKTPKPTVSGVQSAIVVGPAKQEIHTDEFGRVRVQFPWDREGKLDDASSCWIRVSQGWAGTGFGILTVPRVGQEVLIGFLEGDPDEPIVVGRVFNAKNQVPYKLPDHKTRSTWKSQSTPQAEGFNELMFEDLAGKELIYFQAQKNLRKLVKNDEIITVVHNREKLVKANETETTGGVRTEVVGGDRIEITVGNETTVVGASYAKLVKFNAVERTEGDSLLTVVKDQHIITKRDKFEKIEKNSHFSVMGLHNEAVSGSNSLSCGSHDESVGGKYALSAGDVIHIKAGSNIVIEAAADLTLKGPGGFIRIDGGGVTIVGNLVRINSGGGPGAASDASGASPKEPREAIIAEPHKPEMDDVSKTTLGQ